MKNLNYFPYERNQYFYGKLMSVDDFQTEQKYMNDKRRLINRFLHGCGVVCGLNVVQVDDCTVSLEAGVALDFAGREIVVDTPVTRKLSMIEGFDSYTEEDEDNSYLYLCIEYGEKEKDPVYNVAGSGSKAEYNKVAESYRMYLTNREPEGSIYGSASYVEEQKVIYWGSGIRVSQVFPRYVKSGEELEFRVVVENMGQKLPVRFSYELMLDCLDSKGSDRLTVEFDEEKFEKSRRYEIPVSVRAADVKGRSGFARLHRGSFEIRVGNHKVSADPQCYSTVRIVDREIQEVLEKQYYQDAMEEVQKDTYHQSIYLAKINVIQAGPTFVIDSIEPMPFGQYVRSQVLLGVMSRVQKDRLARLEQQIKLQGTGGAVLEKDRDEVLDSPRVATGTVTLDLGIGGVTGQKFFSEEITHGLGLGDVRIVLGQACKAKEDSSVIYGDGDIFEEGSGMVKASLAARADVANGTFVIGLKLLETTTARRVKLHWMAVKDRKEAVYEREVRELFIKPDMTYLRLRETCYFETVLMGAADKRVVWSVREPEGGAIDQHGRYTAPNIPGIFEIVAESAAYPGVRASAFVVIKE